MDEPVSSKPDTYASLLHFMLIQGSCMSRVVAECDLMSLRTHLCGCFSASSAVLSRMGSTLLRIVIKVGT
jgi:hypothetical protein